MGSHLEDNIGRITKAIQHAAIDSGRHAKAVTLVAASKTVEPHHIQQAIDLGLTVFGENRVQEAVTKWPELRSRNAGIELHLIGPLQSNKVRQAVGLFDAIESVDRAKLARAIAEEAEKQGRAPAIYIQVNVGKEPQKSGVLPAEAPALIRECREVYQLNVQGLMCIPPAGLDPCAHFACLRSIAEDHGLRALSMGMSADYLQAIAQGATHVRVGSSIFGARAPLAQ
ncbi:YggS family pyridoxal phosphate-dependent enzyme [Ralstonia solanacearum]|uniref:YggS family pyridoxal phosphate-dependent enzyme n=1 Tax=Ralstonia solanacearum TaxID=305 RepID=UPI0018695FD6|nr:YggS family pyridoxal phosphate-dependent enzyme [Ralstonia solanacearum]QOK84126.1 YggS family pyridoxal phosphate-dependent enzyme [Ralstonia solanacearum]